MLIFAGFLLGAFVLSPLWKDKRYKSLYLIIIFVALVFITGFRSYGYYTDTKVYHAFYQTNAKKSLIDLFLANFDGETKDPFYHFTGSLFAHLGIGFRAWIIIVSMVYYGGFIYVLNRFSKVPFISILGLTALSYVFFTMTGIRQTIAMGICFFAFVKAYDRKLIPFIILVFVAFLYHSSALIFALTYVMINRKLGILHLSLLVVALLMSVLIPGAINAIVRELAWNEDLAAYANTTTGLSVAGYIIQLAIGVASLVISGKDYMKSKEGIALINMVVLGLVFQTFVVRIDNIFRLSMYFSVYGVILLSNATSKQALVSKKDYTASYLIVALAFIAYMLYSGAFANFTMFGGL